ncbi:MAG: hypothetical protein ACOH2B_01250 [Burkholderiaceae bacterium]
MSFARSVLISAFLATLLIGCKKAETPPAPTLGETSGSVAAPENTVPPPDAHMPAAGSGAMTGSGDASGPTQADPAELSKEQESTEMPMPGQANTHSTPDTTDEKK